VTVDRRLNFFAHEVVRIEDVRTDFALVEDVENVFAVGRADRALEHEPLVVAVEDLVVAGLEIVAAGEDEPVVLGELNARLPYAIDAHDLFRALVVDEVAPGLLTVWQNLEEDEHTDVRVEDRRVVERLIAILDLLAVDALAAVGVVLDLDRQIAAHGLDEDLVEDVDVRVSTPDVHVLRRLDPPKIV